MKAAIRQAVFSSIPEAVEFSVSTAVKDDDTLGKGQGFWSFLIGHY
jgi:hypothetical protein